MAPLPPAALLDSAGHASSSSDATGDATLGSLFAQALEDFAGVTAETPPEPARRREPAGSEAALLGVPVFIQVLTQPVARSIELPDDVDPGLDMGVQTTPAALPCTVPVFPQQSVCDTSLLSQPAPSGSSSPVAALPRQAAEYAQSDTSGRPGEDRDPLSPSTGRAGQEAASSPGTRTGELAFAARVTDAVRRSDASYRPEVLRARPVRPAESAEPGSSEPHTEALLGSAADRIAFVARNYEPVSNSGAEISEAAPLTAVRTETEPPAPKTLNELSVRMTNELDQRVDVRIVDRGGELRVAVRSSDSNLADGLRQAVPELVGKLDSGGFRAETWHPAASAQSVAAASESQQSSAEMRDADPQDRGGRFQQQDSQREHRDRGTPGHPDWLDELHQDKGPDFPTGASLGNLR